MIDIKHNMVKAIFLVLFSFFSFWAEAQKYSPELERSYSKKELKQMTLEELSLLEYALSSALYTTALPEKNYSALKSITVLPSIKKFTDASLRIENQNQYFIITGTDKMLVVKSKYVLQNELKNFKK
jgi:hypothetical protein